MAVPSKMIAAIGCAGFLIGTTVAAEADPVADFYSRTPLTLIVSSAPGGGYDGYARVLARHIGQFIPGHPNVVVQNMPGGEGIIAANHLYNVAPKDGSVFALLQNTLPLNQLGKSSAVKFDMHKFNWIGSMSTASSVCAFTDKAALSNGVELLKNEVLVGASAGSTSMVPKVLDSLVGTQFKIVQGYGSTNEVLLAMQRGEVNGLCGWGWDSAQIQARSQFEHNIFHVGLDVATEPDPDLHAKGVPFVMDLVPPGENKDVLSLILSTQEYNRPITMPPGTPKDRLDAVSTAFAKTLEDPAFLDDAKKANMVIRYLDPKDLVHTMSSVLDAKDGIKDRALKELQDAGFGF
ncbi:MAG TPA: hypothetical protein VG271_11790 [Beijerinckiaceae bacterium]|jgi:tripartite-type tricarboxylate transporter receptor subunit TctC|nr:hypothetical protein [Beijerinckiaceae bacterium]